MEPGLAALQPVTARNCHRATIEMTEIEAVAKALRRGVIDKIRIKLADAACAVMDAVGSVNADPRPDLRDHIMNDHVQGVTCGTRASAFRLQPGSNCLDAGGRRVRGRGSSAGFSGPVQASGARVQPGSPGRSGEDPHQTGGLQGR